MYETDQAARAAAAASRALCEALGVDAADTADVVAEMSAASPTVEVRIDRKPIVRHMSMEEWAAIRARMREAARNA
jgi:hypothetical protein